MYLKACRMKIVVIHNKYQIGGGEDVVVENEKKLLESKGHEVLAYFKDNTEIANYSFLRKANLINTSVWSRQSFKELRELIEKIRPDICHVHNYMPLISPSVFCACDEMNVPVVQTLHNYRMLCSNAYLFRNGKVCEECIGKSLYHALQYGCYRDSRIQTFAVARMIETHKRRGTFKNSIDGYICLSEFAKNKFREGGLPREKLFMKPNFLFSDPGFTGSDEEYYLFAGRLDKTKGIDVLVETAKIKPNLKFIIVGDGQYKTKNHKSSNIEYLGQLCKIDLIQRLQNCSALIFPSIWYEAMPMAIIEAFACGKPVIASRLGAMVEIIEEGKTGILFEPGNAKDLASKIEWAASHQSEMHNMGANARMVFEEKYTAESNYLKLMEIYSQAIDHRRNRVAQ